MAARASGSAAASALALITLTLVLLASSGSRSPVLQAQAIKLQPEGREKFYWTGEQFVITCQNNNNIKNVKIRWIGPNGSDITEDKSQRVHAESTGPHGHRLVVMNATAPNDDGKYKCTLGSTDDRNPREHIEFELKLHKTTSFKDTARHLIQPTGQTGTLNCRVEFDPGVLSASVEWVRDNKPIDMHNDSSYKVVDYDPSRQLSQLIITPVTKQHDGIYTCRAMAVTAQLSKISDQDIRLETTYAPAFDREVETVWVERAHSSSSKPSHYSQHNSYGGTNGRTTGHQRGRFNKPVLGAASRGRPLDQDTHTGDPTSQDAATNATSLPQTVRVELRCTCLANPPATIIWRSTQSEYILSKDILPHILDDPVTETDGYNTTSVLAINYNLSPNWPHIHDSYSCLASNKLGKATKKFAVEQGDPPPSFLVGAQKQYNPQTSQFRFTLLGPNSDSAVPDASKQYPEIKPPVDSFRIRAESSTGGSSGSAVSMASESRQSSHWVNSRRHNEHSVQWNLLSGDLEGNLVDSNDFTSQYAPLKLGSPRNFTVNLGRLPSGNQKLFLEAHNAVGWSPNSTYLGDFYIVSGSASMMSFCSLAITMTSLLISLVTMQQPHTRLLVN